MFALRNQVNWRDVVTNADEKPAPCKRFLSLVLDAQILAAAMEFFGMKSMDDMPSKNGFPEEIKESMPLAKQTFLKCVVKNFITTFIINEEIYDMQRKKIFALQQWDEYRSKQPVTADGRYPCRSPGCLNTYKYDGVSRRRHEMTHDPPPIVMEEPLMASAAEDQDSNSKDDVFNYHCSLMNMALMLRNFNDATKEGDGPRIVRCIKIFLLHYKQDGCGSTKYALEALYHLFQLNALLTHRDSERLLWNRSVNNKGGAGNNVPCDLDLEHDNHLFKDMCKGLGANLTSNSVTRISNAFFAFKELLTNLDKEMKIKSTSGEHTKKDVKQDLKKIVKTLTEEKVFTMQEERAMHSFDNIPRDYLQLLDSKTLITWINEHKEKVLLGLRPR